MLKYLIIISALFAFVQPNLAFAQGFDWRVSPRLPFNTPKLFVGASATGAYSFHFGDIDFYEAQINCSKFSSGSGLDYDLALNAEYWLLPELALNAEISRSAFKANFSKENDPLPIRDSKPLITKNILDINASYFNLSIGAKQRLNSYFFIEPNLRFAFLADNKQSQSEEVVSPDNFYFQTSPPSKTRAISESRISDFSKFLLIAKFNFGYDYSVGIFKYISPKIGVSIPLNSYLKTSSYRSLSISLSISAHFGVFEDLLGE